MKIKDIHIRMCRHKQSVMKNSEMRDGTRSNLEFLVITFETDEDLSASTFGFAGRGAEMAGEIANSIFKPFKRKLHLLNKPNVKKQLNKTIDLE